MSGKATVLVTGATGYVAGWIVYQLLEEGHSVHAAVRDPANHQRIDHLEQMAEKLPGNLRFFRADLLEHGSYDDAMDGCEIVFHTASPFTLDVDDPERDLVNPAVKGTRNVLDSCNRVPSVRRVILTSSAVAIYGDNADMEEAGLDILNEEHWNTSSSLDHQPYAYSKVEAERTAWEVAGKQDQWQLITINPSLVLGPGTSANITSESLNIIKQMANGKMKTGAPKLAIGVVDVRDVADMHLRAAFNDQAQGRYLASAENTSFLEIARILKDRFGSGWPFPQRELPTWLLWLVGPIIDRSLTRQMIRRNMGKPLKLDNSKSRQELGMSYRRLDQTVVDMFQQLIDEGVIRKKR